jgi:hypothetical protein
LKLLVLPVYKICIDLPLGMTLSPFVCLLFIDKTSICGRDDMREQSKRFDSRRTTEIRQKIKEVLGWDCTMNDEMLLTNYTVTTDGDLILRLK